MVNDLCDFEENLDEPLEIMKGQPYIHFQIKIDTPGHQQQVIAKPPQHDTVKPQQQPVGNPNMPLQAAHSPANLMERSQI